MGTTIADVARMSGVSLSTVSAVLNKSHGRIRVSDQTRSRILEVAEQLHYQPSFSARALAGGRTFTLGYICGDIQSPFFSELTAVAMQETQVRGYHLLVTVTRWDRQRELECVDTLLQRQVEGIFAVIASLQPGTRQYEYVRTHRVPLVGLEPGLPGLPTVSSDWQPGMDQAVAHLKAAGHHRIALIDVPSAAPAGQSPKLLAFRNACRTHDMEGAVFDSPPDIHDCRLFGQTLADHPDRPRAVIVGSDFTALGIMRGFRDRGLDIPRDVAVVGMDGTLIGAYCHPPLTTIAQDIRQRVVRSLDLLLDMIDHKTSHTDTILVPTHLVVRESA